MNIKDKSILELPESHSWSMETKRMGTSKTSGAFKSGLPDTIVIHYTGGTTLGGAVSTLINPQVKASAHLVVGGEKENYIIEQLVPFTHIAWHAGSSKYAGRERLNKYAIGIEIVNPGYLFEDAEGNIKTKWGQTVAKNDAQFLTHKNEHSPKYWHSYKEQQLEVVREICLALKATFPIKYVVGHDEISPGRKQDPGPCFPIDALRAQILDNRSVDDPEDEESTVNTGIVNTNNLNIRAAGNGNATKVALPLKKGANVSIIEAQNGWYRVKTEIEGWVYGKYIDL